MVSELCLTTTNVLSSLIGDSSAFADETKKRDNSVNRASNSGWLNRFIMLVPCPDFSGPSTRFQSP